MTVCFKIVHTISGILEILPHIIDDDISCNLYHDTVGFSFDKKNTCHEHFLQRWHLYM